MKEQGKPLIVVVDDEPTYRKYLTENIKNLGYSVIPCSSGMECIKAVQKNLVDVVLADMVLPDLSGLKILEFIKQVSPSTDVIMVTGYATMDTAIKALKMGAQDYITKPVNLEELRITLKKYIERKAVIKENIKLARKVRLIEDLKNLSIYTSVESFMNGLLRIVKEYMNLKKGFCALTSKNKITIPVTLGINKWSALKVFKNYYRKILSKSTLDKYFHVKNRNSPKFIIALKGKDRNGFLIFHAPSPQDSRIESELLEEIVGYASVYFRTITDMAEARYLTYIDDLTELYNPRYLKLIVNKELKRAKESGTPFSILFLDLDHFKEVNDTYGHLVGGQILCEVAKVLKNSVRTVDVVVRYGGDEYVIVLFNTDRERAGIIAERIKKNIDTHIFLGREGYRIRLTACIGIAVFPDDGKTYKKLIESADRAMYIGKETKRDSIHFANELKKV